MMLCDRPMCWPVYPSAPRSTPSVSTATCAPVSHPTDPCTPPTTPSPTVSWTPPRHQRREAPLMFSQVCAGSWWCKIKAGLVIKIYPTANLFASGTMSVYGLKNTSPGRECKSFLSFHLTTDKRMHVSPVSWWQSLCCSQHHQHLDVRCHRCWHHLRHLRGSCSLQHVVSSKSCIFADNFSKRKHTYRRQHSQTIIKLILISMLNRYTYTLTHETVGYIYIYGLNVGK